METCASTTSITAHGGFTDPEYASVGLTEEQARQAGLDYAAAAVPYSANWTGR